MLKSVDYSYPTSPNADRFGWHCGCYTVSISENELIPFEAIEAFETEAEAFKFAESLPFPFSRYSRKPARLDYTWLKDIVDQLVSDYHLHKDIFDQNYGSLIIEYPAFDHYILRYISVGILNFYRVPRDAKIESGSTPQVYADYKHFTL